MGACMGDGTKTLGQRIVEAARLATIAHLSQAQGPFVARREAVGGADAGTFKDEGPLSPGDDLRAPRGQSPFYAEGEAA